MTNTVNNVLLVQNISKRYVGIQALDNVSIDFKKGETHALVGKWSRKIHIDKNYIGWRCRIQ